MAKPSENPALPNLCRDELRAIRNAQSAEIPNDEIGQSLVMLGLGLILAADGWEGVQAELGEAKAVIAV